MPPGDVSHDALRVLHVEDSADDGELVVRLLRKSYRAVEHHRVESEAELRAALAARPWDVVLSDWTLPGFGGQRALAILAESGLDVPFVIVSGSVGEDQAVEAMLAGAHDYVLKDRLHRLTGALDRELRAADRRRTARAAVATQRATEAQLARVEDQLQRAQRLEAMGRLAGGVAHDFNNILSVVLSLSQFVAEDPALPRHLQDDIEQIKQAATRAADLTRQLLAFSRQEPIALAVVDLGELVRGVDRMLRTLVGPRVELTIAAAAVDRVRADRTQLERVVVNLVVNARDALGPAGGRIAIDVADVVLDDAFARAHLDLSPGRHVRLTVRDWGCGITPDTLPRIFEPFFTTKAQGTGTGLGLATVFQIVRASRGLVTVDSELGRGTTFAVYLPSVTLPGA